MARNSALNKAVAAKKDEFYTQLTDIEKELLTSILQNYYPQQEFLEDLIILLIRDNNRIKKADFEKNPQIGKHYRNTFLPIR